METKIQQLVVLSGKGGTGKTCVSAAFAHLASCTGEPIPVVLADADVDAANLKLLLTPQILKREDFRGGQVAVIYEETCMGCGDCAAVCRFGALLRVNGTYMVNPTACDGCAACFYQCPTRAINMHEQIVGEWFQSKSQYGPLIHAALRPAQENSGKLVTLVKQRARLMAMDLDIPLVIVDGPPGIGCPVISAAAGADLALIVAEPSMAGVDDMQRVLSTTDHFGVHSFVCINKANIYPAGTIEIENYCKEHNISIAGKVPFDADLLEAMVQGQPVTVFNPESPASIALREVWNRVMYELQQV